jgi:hypothetical protein
MVSRKLLSVVTVIATSPVYIYIYIFVKLQLGFNPVAVVQQYNRQVTQITHKQSTNTIQNTTINDNTTANT